MKTSGAASETANPSGLALSNGADGGVARENFDPPQFSSVSPSQAYPNGADGSATITPPENPLSEVEGQIIRLWREHPDWSFRKIGRECSVTHKRAQRVIARAIAEEGSQ